MHVQRNTEARTCNHCCNRKEMSITQTVCVFAALGIQHAMSCAILSSVVCPALQYFFPHYLINGTIFEKKSY